MQFRSDDPFVMWAWQRLTAQTQASFQVLFLVGLFSWKRCQDFSTNKIVYYSLKTINTETFEFSEGQRINRFYLQRVWKAN